MVTILREVIARGEPFRLGEVVVSFDREGWVLRSVPRPSGVAAAAPAEAATREIAGDPDALREWVRFDERGRYRPLSGARTMRGGWFARGRGEGDLVEALEAIYPLALRHADQDLAGSLRVVAIEAVLARQTGRYAAAARLGDDGRRIAQELLCGLCVRVPAWVSAPGGVALHADEAPREVQIPCPEACSVLVSLCREAALWERERTQPAEPDPSAGFADFESAGNEIREAWLRARACAANTEHGKREPGGQQATGSEVHPG